MRWIARTLTGPNVSRGTLALALCALLPWGCSSRRHSDLLEARLRDQEDRLAEMRQQFEMVAAERDRHERENADLRTRLAGHGANLPTPEQSDVLFRVTGISINKLLSSGTDTDDRPGDDALVVMVAPHDEQEDLVKLPGTFELTAYDMTLPEGQQQLGSWSFDPTETRERWHNGFAGAGFMFEVKWDRPPASSEVLVHVRYTTVDGRQFDKTQTVHVKPVPAEMRSIAEEIELPVLPTGRRDENAGRVRLLNDSDLFE